MRQNIMLIVIIGMFLTTISPIHAADQLSEMATKDYVIGSGDVLEISVWNNETLTKTVTVLSDGKIHYPLIGDVKADGKTLSALEKELNEKIGAFISNPNLTVMTQQVASMVFYVIGEVQNPGVFSLNASINVLQALAIAGGFNEWAETKKIQIFRESKDRTEVLKISYDDITKRKKLDQNIRLRRGDVVVVP